MKRIKRTGKTQREKTPTGYITTAEELVNQDGKKYRRFVQIGYTSNEDVFNNVKLKEGK